MKHGNRPMKRRNRRQMSEAKLMLKVLEVCIRHQVVPAVNSRCHKILRRIIRSIR